jgi:hypothetical protein
MENDGYACAPSIERQTFFKKTFCSIGGCGGRHYEINVSSPKWRKGDTNIRVKIGIFEVSQQRPVIVEEFATEDAERGVV